MNPDHRPAEKSHHQKSDAPRAHQPAQSARSQHAPRRDEQARREQRGGHRDSRVATHHARREGHAHSHDPSTDRSHGATRGHTLVEPTAVGADAAASATPHVATFDEFNLRGEILKAVHAEGYHTPTPIQAQAIGPIMAGRDVLGCAQTGTGKTAAFALPILHRLLDMPIEQTQPGPHLPRVLVLSPTRELATQIGDSFATYGRNTRLRHTVIFGGVSQFHQVKALQRGVDILVATPGRLLDLMDQRLVNLSAVRIFVLDEADRMLDMGFIKPINQIASVLVGGSSRQTLLFSATMPREIAHLADALLHEPVRVSVAHRRETTALITQSVYMVPKASKPALLKHILGDTNITRMIVFTRTKHGADRLSRQLNHAGINADAIHGNKGQNQRNRALDGFRRGRARVLVATDVAARGLDVDGITHVVNFDLPIEPEAYVHRIGRTGRAGASGVAMSFCDVEEHGLLRAIERLLGKQVPLITPNEMPKLPDPQSESPVATDRNREQSAGRQLRHGESRSDDRGARDGEGSRREDRDRAHHVAPGRKHEGRHATPTHKREQPRPARGGHAAAHPAQHSRRDESRSGDGAKPKPHAAKTHQSGGVGRTENRPAPATPGRRAWESRRRRGSR